VTQTSQDAKVDLKLLIVAIIPIYCLSETINVLFFLFLSIFNKLIYLAQVKLSDCLHFIFFLCSVWPGDGTAALFVPTEIRGNIRRLRGVEAMANW
jgi:hypothetical protein